MSGDTVTQDLRPAGIGNCFYKASPAYFRARTQVRDDAVGNTGDQTCHPHGHRGIVVINQTDQFTGFSGFVDKYTGDLLAHSARHVEDNRVAGEKAQIIDNKRRKPAVDQSGRDLDGNSGDHDGNDLQYRDEVYTD